MFRTLNTTALWTITLAAAGILMISMGARQSIGSSDMPRPAKAGVSASTIRSCSKASARRVGEPGRVSAQAR